MKKVSSLGRIRKKCDDLMSPMAVKKSPKCLLCGKPSQVGHHFIKKSESNRLRHEPLNIIALCNSCHCALHSHETIYSGRIIEIKGLDWFNKLRKMKQETIKVNKSYYEAKYLELSKGSSKVD